MHILFISYIHGKKSIASPIIQLGILYIPNAMSILGAEDDVPILKDIVIEL